MFGGGKVLTKTYDDCEGNEPTGSGIFLKGERPPRPTANRHHDAGLMLDWLEQRLARRYAGEAALDRLANSNDRY
jgi:hypothetical protein